LLYLVMQEITLKLQPDCLRQLRSPTSTCCIIIQYDIIIY
jgi:hypothetical protein